MAITVRELVTKLTVDGDKGTAKLARFGLAVNGVKAGIDILVGSFRAMKSVTFDFVRDQTAAADKIAKTARTIGISGEEFQRLAFAAERSGSSLSSLSRAARNVSRNLRDASRGEGKAFVAALKDINLESKDFIGLDFEGKLGLIGDALNTVDDGLVRTAIAQKIFGEKAGPELASLLQGGTAEIRKLGDEAERLGLVMSEEGLKAAEDYQDALVNITAVFNGIKRSIAIDAAPALQKIIDRFRELVLANRKIIKQNLGKFLDLMTKALEAGADKFEAIFDAVLELIGAFGDFIDLVLAISDALGGMQQALKTAAAGIIAFKLAGALMLGPIPAAILLLGLLAASFIKIETSADRAARAQKRFGKSVGDEKNVDKKEKARLSKKLSTSLSTGRIDEKFISELAGIDEKDLLDIQRDAKRVKRSALGGGAGGLSGAIGGQFGGASRNVRATQIAELIREEKLSRRAAKDNSETEVDEFTGLMNRLAEVTGTETLFDRARGGGVGGAGGKGGGSTETLSEDELLDLIAKAGATGQSLTGLIGNRRVESGSNPVAVIRITKNSIVQNINAPVTVNGADSATVEELAERVGEEATKIWRREIDEAITELQPAFAR